MSDSEEEIAERQFKIALVGDTEVPANPNQSKS
jgi:hypothetical protein